MFRFSKIVSILLILFTVNTHVVTGENREIQNFFDFVREESQRELEAIPPADPANPPVSEGVRNMIICGVSSTILCAVWFLLMRFINRKYFIHKKWQEETEPESFIFSLTPLEVSAVININDFTTDDVVVMILELIRRGVLICEEPDIIKRSDSGVDGGDINDAEDFLIRWLIGTIGNNEYFSTAKLGEYLSKNSNAVQFGIDFDIWSDEARDIIGFDIVNDEAEKVKSYCIIIVLAYIIFGMVLLYLTNSLFSLTLFICGYLTFKFSQRPKIRTPEAELMYNKLRLCRKQIINSKMSDGLFLYAVPLKLNDNFDKMFAANLRDALKDAVKVSNDILNEG